MDASGTWIIRSKFETQNFELRRPFGSLTTAPDRRTYDDVWRVERLVSCADTPALSAMTSPVRPAMTVIPSGVPRRGIAVRVVAKSKAISRCRRKPGRNSRGTLLLRVCSGARMTTRRKCRGKWRSIVSRLAASVSGVGMLTPNAAILWQ